MASIKMTKAELDNLINEEAQKVKKEYLLKKQLHEVEEELKLLKEVHAGTEMEPGKEGVHAGQKTAVFTKKGSSLVEDDVEDVIPDSTEAGGEEISNDDEVVVEKGKLLDAIKELGKQLNLTGMIDFDAVEEIPGEENVDSVEINTEELGNEEGGENVAPENSDVEVVTGADDAVESGEAEPSEEGAEEAELDECGDAAVVNGTPAEKETIMESPEAARKKERLAEEVNRWKFLAGM